MALKKQTIRGLEEITLNDKPTTKEELITLSESWSENEELVVRKMLQQGGKCKIGKNVITVSRPDKDDYSLVR
jgi:hypothetical protein